MAKAKDVFDNHCCGNCMFSKLHDKDLMCHANPPILLASDTGTEYFRYVPVEHQDPPCHVYYMKMDA